MCHVCNDATLTQQTRGRHGGARADVGIEVARHINFDDGEPREPRVSANDGDGAHWVEDATEISAMCSLVQGDDRVGQR